MRGARVTRARGSLALRAAAVLGSFAGLGCGSTDFVVAEVSTRVVTGQVCGSADASTCPPGTYCEMTTCDALTGTCQVPPAPATCAAEAPRLMCGCNDGLFYWNDCVRQQRGIAASQPCVPPTSFIPRPCDKDLPCPFGSNCDEFIGSCDAREQQTDGGSPIVPPTCWILPDVCPIDTTGLVVARTCNSPPMCIDNCSAIRNEQPYILLPLQSPCE
jgi:hypothetical protein